MHSLYETVNEVLSAGRVGIPVFVRCTVQIKHGAENIGSVLARIQTVASSWLQASPLKVYALSSYKSSQITVTIKYAGGQTSVVSVNTTSGTTSHIDLMLLGNKGAFYHDAYALAPGFDISAEPVPVPDWLIEAMEQTLRSGKPALVEEVMDVE
jgi:hypothetical protein